MATHAQQTTWQLYEERYADLMEAVRQDHIAHGKFGGGHDFTHALMVTRYAVLIADDLDIGRLAWVAAICHNTDRIYHDVVRDSQIVMILRTYLGETNLTEEEKRVVIEAILEHHNLNKEEDSPVTVVLKDADRLANIGPNLFIRSGQHYHDLPAYDPRYVAHPDPEATYKNPKTVLHDVMCSLEWEPWIRTKGAMLIAEKYFNDFRRYRYRSVEQMQEVGFLDDGGNSTYPFPDDLELAYEQETAH